MPVLRALILNAHDSDVRMRCHQVMSARDVSKGRQQTVSARADLVDCNRPHGMGNSTYVDGPRGSTLRSSERVRAQTSHLASSGYVAASIQHTAFELLHGIPELARSKPNLERRPIKLRSSAATGIFKPGHVVVESSTLLLHLANHLALPLYPPCPHLDHPFRQPLSTPAFCPTTYCNTFPRWAFCQLKLPPHRQRVYR